MNLPLRLPWDRAQDRWASILAPLLNSLLPQGQLLQDVVLINGVNVINHKLGRKQQGWLITDVRTSVVLFRSADFNDLTLTLTSNAACTVSIWVF